MFILLITLSMLVLTLSACSLPAPEHIEPSPTNTPEPPKTPTSTPPPDFTIRDTEASPLRFYAQQKNFHIGAAVAYEPLVDEPLYAQTLSREFNMLTAENVMKFDTIHPSRDTYDFLKADALVTFAQENNMQVRGHTLVWHSQLPEWLTDHTWTRDELLKVLRYRK